MSEPTCSVHGPEHIVALHFDPELARHRCAADAGDGTKCGRIALLPPPRLPWHVRLYDRLPERATVERIMCTLVIGFWIAAFVWARFFL